MSFEKTLMMNRLFDVYGKLLTENRQAIFQYYYHEDYSYQEIADILNISRAGVFDALSKAQQQLEHYEQELNIIRRESDFIKALKALKDSKVDACIDAYMGGTYE